MGSEDSILYRNVSQQTGDRIYLLEVKLSTVKLFINSSFQPPRRMNKVLILSLTMAISTTYLSLVNIKLDLLHISLLIQDTRFKHGQDFEKSQNLRFNTALNTFFCFWLLHDVAEGRDS